MIIRRSNYLMDWRFCIFPWDRTANKLIIFIIDVLDVSNEQNDLYSDFMTLTVVIIACNAAESKDHLKNIHIHRAVGRGGIGGVRHPPKIGRFRIFGKLDARLDVYSEIKNMCIHLT